ncbi:MULTISPECIES: P-II family nitrogen regulator [unclassified Methylocaldum]|jgi:nitrogen regulatory protein P-II 1|uniref:P-II family nitrogen regulator n=1 Tax=unclassified Methylocaldum TaxID=2622260 RepID=UPI0012EB1A85|nr:P-II family nitrogen regulator [Methylocaldum sp. RMAD-M]MBP1151851.1 nitrogen regulatory protein PII [Methylocaldum sp. RMAD-M]MVF23950.1 P-II family nitrogen regulator [Methylocaldum sp. BRCS4]
MKEIRAYVQPYILSRLVQMLAEIPDFPGMSVSDCEGFGRDRIEAGKGFTPFALKKRLEIFTPDELVEPIVSAIMKHAHTGHPGDGKLYVIDVLEGSRIRTGERGKEIV